jgi:hypothetical protein
MTTEESITEVDIPCDVQQDDETGHVWAFLDEVGDPSRIVAGAIVVSGDDVDPVLARIVSLPTVQRRQVLRSRTGFSRDWSRRPTIHRHIEARNGRLTSASSTSGPRSSGERAAVS